MRWLVLVGALVVAAGGSGCAENDQSIVIQRFAASEDEMSCMLTAEGMNQVGRGSMYPKQADEGFTTIAGYFLAPAVVNLLPIRGTTMTAETNGVVLNAFDVELKGSTPAIDAAIPAEMRSRRLSVAGGYLAPGGASHSVSVVEAIPPQVRSAVLAAFDPASPSFPQVNIRIRPIGSQGGLSLVGAWVTFAVDVCSVATGGFNVCFPAQDRTCVIPQ
jgi:hypothetical protein